MINRGQKGKEFGVFTSRSAQSLLLKISVPQVPPLTATAAQNKGIEKPF
jgi:hypothetical protein